jgi:hypothetical protein
VNQTLISLQIAVAPRLKVVSLSLEATLHLVKMEGTATEIKEQTNTGAPSSTETVAMPTTRTIPTIGITVIAMIAKATTPAVVEEETGTTTTTTRTVVVTTITISPSTTTTSIPRKASAQSSRSP